MKRVLVWALAATMAGAVSAQKQKTIHTGYPIDPVPFTSVKVVDGFWGQRLKASREVTVPLAFSKCEETGRYENFVKAAHPSDEYKEVFLSTIRMYIRLSRELPICCRLIRTKS